MPRYPSVFSRAALAVLAAALLGAGCASVDLGPRYSPPPVRMPQPLPAEPAPVPSGATTQPVAPEQPIGQPLPPFGQVGPGAMAQQQKMMLYLFPFMYLFMGVNIPIGVLVYWLTTNLWTMGQQYILIHNNPAPGTPAYVDWEERMRAKGKDPVEIAARRRGARKPSTSTAYDPTKVARQGSDGGATPAKATGTTSSAPESSAEPSVQRQVIQRQQPRKNSRAARKQ